jgi:hypothetical protein
VSICPLWLEHTLSQPIDNSSIWIITLQLGQRNSDNPPTSWGHDRVAKIGVRCGVPNLWSGRFLHILTDTDRGRTCLVTTAFHYAKTFFFDWRTLHCIAFGNVENCLLSAHTRYVTDYWIVCVTRRVCLCKMPMFPVSVPCENAFNAVPVASSFKPDLLHCFCS